MMDPSSRMRGEAELRREGASMEVPKDRRATAATHVRSAEGRRGVVSEKPRRAKNEPGGAWSRTTPPPRRRRTETGAEGPGLSEWGRRPHSVAPQAERASGDPEGRSESSDMGRRPTLEPQIGAEGPNGGLRGSLRREPKAGL